MKNAYTNKTNRFKFKIKELKNLDKAWNLINEFRITKISRAKYRKNIIDKINNKYTLDQFYYIEIIIEKMYWNLRDKLKLIFDEQHKYKKTSKVDSLHEIQDNILIKNKKATLSNIRKSYIENDKSIFYVYDYPNDFDLIVSSVMINRSAYETIMEDIVDIFNLNIDPYTNIIEFDYPFPNLNTIKPFAYSKIKRLDNILNLYYVKNSDGNWFL